MTFTFSLSPRPLPLLKQYLDLCARLLYFPPHSRIGGDMGPRYFKARADLAPRTALEKAYRESDSRAYREIEQSVQREKNGYATPNDSLSSTLPAPTNHSSQAAVSMNNYGYQNGYLEYGGQRSQQMPSQGMFPSGPSLHEQHTYILNGQGFTFRGSPFYHFVSRIGSVHTCEGNVPPPSVSPTFVN